MDFYNLTCKIYVKHYILSYLAIGLFVNLLFVWFSIEDKNLTSTINLTMFILHIVFTIGFKMARGRECARREITDEIKACKNLIKNNSRKNDDDDE